MYFVGVLSISAMTKVSKVFFSKRMMTIVCHYKCDHAGVGHGPMARLGVRLPVVSCQPALRLGPATCVQSGERYHEVSTADAGGRLRNFYRKF